MHRIPILLRSIVGLPLLCTWGGEAIAADNLVPVACKFEKLPLMLLISRGGMGAKDNTIQIGNASPVPLSIGSGLMTARFQGQEFVFAVAMPASVSIHGSGSDTLTYDGECISSPPR
ncbi:hypothetical protein [Pararhizobium sp. LjRoot238]|uniref:hypothetical protein n=1 Tax=Pararhizobium sp. LjRoot238 TaxID=3342293 RepID=UPI003ECD968E